jgi:hypothetical protein
VSESGAQISEQTSSGGASFILLFLGIARSSSSSSPPHKTDLFARSIDGSHGVFEIRARAHYSAACSARRFQNLLSRA